MNLTVTARFHRKRALWLVGLGTVGVILAQLGLLEPLSHVVPRCPTYTLTGFYCPGCGGTRALVHLLHFDLPGALHMNALAVLAAPVAGYWTLWPVPRRVLGRWPLISLIIVITAFTIVRNLPMKPFTLLAPY